MFVDPLQGLDLFVGAALVRRLVGGLDVDAHQIVVRQRRDPVRHAAALRSVAEAARIYFEVGTRIGFDWLRARIEKLAVDGPWQAVARTGLRDAALRVQRRLTERVLALKGRGDAEARVNAWVETAGKDLAHWQRTLADMRAAGAGDFATLNVGVEAVRKLAI